MGHEQGLEKRRGDQSKESQQTPPNHPVLEGIQNSAGNRGGGYSTGVAGLPRRGFENRSRRGVQETAVSYRAQRPSNLWHILALIIPIIMCVIIDLIPILALMPMSYYIFPNPSQNLKPEEETYRLRLRVLRLSSTAVSS
jgi:hypothetical protein